MQTNSNEIKTQHPPPKTGFSAQSPFFPAYIATFNAVWAALPTIAFGVFEQDVSAAAALAHPALYSETRTQTHA